MSPDNKQFSRSKEELIRLLEESNIMPTSQRIGIAEILLSKPQHLSADQVLAMARENGANVSKATVYNTLNLFADKALLKELIISGGKIFFDSNVIQHHHFFNEETGELTDINQGQLTISNIPELPENTVNAGIDVIVRIKNADI